MQFHLFSPNYYCLLLLLIIIIITVNYYCFKFPHLLACMAFIFGLLIAFKKKKKEKQ